MATTAPVDPSSGADAIGSPLKCVFMLLSLTLNSSHLANNYLSSPEPGALPSSSAHNMSPSESLTDTIATTLRQTSLASAAVEPMARTLAALADDLTAFDKAAEAQLRTIELPSTAARSLLLEALRSLARFRNLYAIHLPAVGSTPDVDWY